MLEHVDTFKVQVICLYCMMRFTHDYMKYMLMHGASEC